MSAADRLAAMDALVGRACADPVTKLPVPEWRVNLEVLKTNAADRERAKAVCRRCPVRQKCLEYALTYGERWSVFGGYDDDERAALLGQDRPVAV